MNIAVSVIVPVFNAELYLKRCIESILKQTLQNFELILVDDGSTDKSREICDYFANTDKRIKVIHQKNSGVSAARNNGIKQSNGEYIEFVDADDFLNPNTLELTYESANANNSDLVVFGVNKIFVRNNTVVKKHTEKIHPGVFEIREFMKYYSDYAARSIMGPVWNKLFRREILTKNNIFFDTTIKNNEDNFFNYAVFENSKVVSVVADVFYNYTDENLNSVSRKKGIDFFEVYKKTYLRAIQFLKNTDAYIENIEFQNTYFLNLVFGVLVGCVHKSRKLTKTNKIKINSIITDSIVQEALEFYNVKRFDRKIIFFLMKKNMIGMIIICIRIMKFIKR